MRLVALVAILVAAACADAYSRGDAVHMLHRERAAGSAAVVPWSDAALGLSPVFARDSAAALPVNRARARGVSFALAFDGAAAETGWLALGGARARGEGMGAVVLAEVEVRLGHAGGRVVHARAVPRYAEGQGGDSVRIRYVWLREDDEQDATRALGAVFACAVVGSVVLVGAAVLEHAGIMPHRHAHGVFGGLGSVAQHYRGPAWVGRTPHPI